MNRLPFAIDMLGLTLILVFVFSQVVWPLWKGTKLFPLFSYKRRWLAAMETEIKDEEEIKRMEKNLQKHVTRKGGRITP